MIVDPAGVSLDVWLIRHAETVSYLGDHGLSERGREQIRAAAAELGSALASAATTVLHAGSARARETAAELTIALRRHAIDVAGPSLDNGFDNFAAAIDGRVVPHDQIRLALHEARQREDGAPQHLLDWQRDAGRFAAIHEAPDDPIRWWLSTPTVSYEPPSHVVRRIWRAMASLAERHLRHTLVCTHSGPIRAIAAHALQSDPGEPDHVERLEARLHGCHPGDAAEITFRGTTISMSIPTLIEPRWP